MTKYIAAFDIGTTAVKGVLVSVEGKVAYSASRNIETIFKGDQKEQSPKDWYESFILISKEFFKNGYSNEDVIGIIFSGQMQDLIAVDENLNPVCNAILYSDGRAHKEADEINKRLGVSEVSKITGNNLDGSMPFPKLLWLKENHKELYNRTHKILISSKDYCITRLTGKFATDVTSASTAGFMNIKTKKWSKTWCDQIGLDNNKLPEINYSEDIVGAVTREASLESGYKVDTPVYAGTGDAGATTLASGISKKGDFNINLGTSGWVACISEDTLSIPGVFNLSAIPKDLYINVVPFLNAGNVHKWISKTFSKSEEEVLDYGYISKLLDSGDEGSNGLLFLPYIAGERFPILDTDIKGCFYGITPNTRKQDMVRAALEGVAFSIRQGIEAIGVEPSKITLIGGGGKEKIWCQILADVLGKDISLNTDSEFLPAIALTSSVLLNLGILNDYSSFTNSILERKDTATFKTNKQNHNLYNNMYQKFIRLYPALKSL